MEEPRTRYAHRARGPGIRYLRTASSASVMPVP